MATVGGAAAGSLEVDAAVGPPGIRVAIAGKAKQWGTYVSASLHERDPEFPDYYLNTAVAQKFVPINKKPEISPWLSTIPQSPGRWMIWSYSVILPA